MNDQTVLFHLLMKHSTQHLKIQRHFLYSNSFDHCLQELAATTLSHCTEQYYNHSMVQYCQ